MKLKIEKVWTQFDGEIESERFTIFQNKTYEEIIDYLKGEYYSYDEELNMWFFIEEGEKYIALIYN